MDRVRYGAGSVKNFPKNSGERTRDALRTLARWTSIPSNPNQGCVLVYGGNERFALGEYQVLPWFLG